MAEKFPSDRFDQPTPHTQRVGAHRAPDRKYRRLKYVAWSALAAAVLAGVGIGAVVVLDNGVFTAADDTTHVVSTVAPSVDPSVPITVLNGTPTDTLDNSAAAVLTKAGFTVAASTNASQSNLTQSVVYYSAPNYLAVARAAADTLKISTVKVSTDFSTSIGSNVTVVLGTDYVPSPVG